MRGGNRLCFTDVCGFGFPAGVREATKCNSVVIERLDAALDEALWFFGEYGGKRATNSLIGCVPPISGATGK